jgi:hypothetical protein
MNSATLFHDAECEHRDQPDDHCTRDHDIDGNDIRDAEQQA